MINDFEGIFNAKAKLYVHSSDLFSRKKPLTMKDMKGMKSRKETAFSFLFFKLHALHGWQLLIMFRAETKDAQAVTAQ